MAKIQLKSGRHLFLQIPRITGI